ncbi:hypothetical protein [Brevundimonas diminuta]|uniref:DUF2163 domain-containing protein n=1 Tax=Brevundimonas diminuta TaxID=293 RepID=A0A410NVJ1_BREDI|nr:hypothetical protein [Brevundimonas diminuta]QAT13891.1 hypothetical protein EQG53_05675 [Brevundimonas diminuta]QQB88743.1 hypothetical protein I6H83_16750 [Brevundimonas diminuta]GEC02330.1 hypothetical protein BDI01nite_33940 [Brevundimonas diminuta]
MSMSTAMLTALQSRNPLLVHLLKIELPGKTIRLVDGSGFVLWGAESYTAEDADFGKIAGFGEFTEAEGTEAPRQTVQLLPTGNAAIAALTAPNAQGSPVTIYAAAIDRQTGQVIGEPDVRFVGELDDAGFNHAQNSSLLELELATIWERLFDDNEGHRWNDAFWTYLYGANARAFQHVTNAGQKLFWGYNGPSSGSGGSYGGGNGSIGGGNDHARYDQV